MPTPFVRLWAIRQTLSCDDLFFDLDMIGSSLGMHLNDHQLNRYALSVWSGHQLEPKVVGCSFLRSRARVRGDVDSFLRPLGHRLTYLRRDTFYILRTDKQQITVFLTQLEVYGYL